MDMAVSIDDPWLVKMEIRLGGGATKKRILPTKSRSEVQPLELRYAAFCLQLFRANSQVFHGLIPHVSHKLFY